MSTKCPYLEFDIPGSACSQKYYSTVFGITEIKMLTRSHLSFEWKWSSLSSDLNVDQSNDGIYPFIL